MRETDLIAAISPLNRTEIGCSHFTACLPHALYNEPDCSSMEVPGITWIFGCAGLSDIVFMFRRDGIRFTRFREAFIRPGRDIRNWHGRAVEVGPTLVSTGDLVSLQFHWVPKGGNYCPPFFRSPERSFLHVSSGVRRLETASHSFRESW